MLQITNKFCLKFRLFWRLGKKLFKIYLSIIQIFFKPNLVLFKHNLTLIWNIEKNLVCSLFKNHDTYRKSHHAHRTSKSPTSANKHKHTYPHMSRTRSSHSPILKREHRIASRAQERAFLCCFRCTHHTRVREDRSRDARARGRNSTREERASTRHTYIQPQIHVFFTSVYVQHILHCKSARTHTREQYGFLSFLSLLPTLLVKHYYYYY